MSTYLIINLLIIAIPLSLIAEKKVTFYRKLPALTAAIGIVGVPYILWDIAAVKREDWGFNPDYISGIEFLTLPIEEILFFITVPFSCIFIYESLRVYVKDTLLSLPRYSLYYAAGFFLLLGLLNHNKPYTFTVLIFSGVLFVVALLIRPSFFTSSLYWIYIGITFIPFLVVNYFLTSLPVVTYGDDAIIGVRITTIPVEDFLYSFSLLTSYLLIYLTVQSRWQLKNI